MIRIYIAIAIFTLVGGASYGAYVTWNKMQAKIEYQAEMIATQKVALASSAKTITDLKNNAQEQEKANRDLAINLQKAEASTDDLRQKLSDHDLTRLTLKKPGLIERRVNGATQSVFSELESITAK